MTWWCDICLGGNPDGVRSCGRCGTPARGPQPAPVSPVMAAGAGVSAPAVTYVAREAELAAIEGLLGTVIHDRRGGLISILGGPGIGKSRLLRAARGEAGVSGVGGIDWYQVRCLPYATMWPYGPVVELADQLPGPPVSDPFVARLLDLPAGDLLGSVPADAFHGGLHQAMNSWLATLGRDRPVVVAIEDIQWADWASLALLGELAGLAAHSPVVLAVTSRPDGRFRVGRLTEAFGSLPQQHTKLSGLDRAATGALLGAWLDRRPSPELIDVVAERTQGNPLAIEQIGRVLPGWGESGEPGPTSTCQGTNGLGALDALISARIDALPVSTARVLMTASVIGRVFGPAALSAIVTDGVVDMDPATIDAALNRLVTEGFLDPTIAAGQPALMFHHAAIEEVAYGRLSPDERRDLHRRARTAAAQLYGSGPETADRVARHADLGQVGGAAVDDLTRAAARARRLLVIDRAICQLRRAVAVAANHPATADRVPQLQLEVAGLEHDRGRFEEAIALFQEILAGERLDEDPARVIEARRGLAASLRAKGECRRALEAVDDGLAHHPRGAALWLERGRALNRLGRGEEGQAAWETGLRVAGGPGGESPLIADLLLELAAAETASHVGDALEHGLAAADVLERLGDLRGLALALLVVVDLYRELGRHEEAAAAGRRATALAERTGLIEEGTAGAERRPIAKTAC
jgi:predicted ATPase